MAATYHRLNKQDFILQLGTIDSADLASAGATCAIAPLEGEMVYVPDFDQIWVGKDDYTFLPCYGTNLSADTIVASAISATNISASNVVITTLSATNASASTILVDTLYIGDANTYLSNSSGDINVNTAATKTIELQTVVYDDLRIVPGATTFAGGSDPTLQSWQPAATGATYKVWKFNNGDEIFFTCQVPHSYKEGANIKVHAHWTPGNRGTEEGTATVGWAIDYSWANIESVVPSSSTADLTDACQSTDDEHLMTPEVEIDGTGKGISSMISCRFYRNGGTWSGTLANAPALLEVDFHFPIDTMGSRNWGAK